MQIFGTSGIRFKVDYDLLMLAFKCGICTGNHNRRVVVARDSRTSSPALMSALSAGLNASGASYWDAGLLPTPALAYAARNFDLGVMITASHNP
ncbi:MAG: phosphoglucosamine mutase, partial [Dehalococcoidales bacterium]